MSIWNYLQLCDVLRCMMQEAFSEVHNLLKMIKKKRIETAPTSHFTLHFLRNFDGMGSQHPCFFLWPEQGNKELWHVQWGHGGLVQTMLCVGKLGWAELDQNKTSRSTETLAPGPREALMDLWICRCLELLFWGQGQQDIHIYVQLIHHCILQVLMLAPENVPRMVCSY